MKRKTRRILLVIVGLIAILIGYGLYNFNTDKNKLLSLKSDASAGNLYTTFKVMDTIQFQNPLMKIAYIKWKSKMISRFKSNDKLIEHITEDDVVNTICDIYRNYWKQELLKPDKKRTDIELYEKLSKYLVENNLTKLTPDSLQRVIKNDEELTRVLESRGFQSKFMFRNGIQDLFIWKDETIKSYNVSLPKEKIPTKVVFINNYILNGFTDFATFGSSTVGGWVSSDEQKLFCNQNEYDTNSEKFKISYLKHESLHFSDLKNYKELSSADLEYRAKLVELMYCSKISIYDRIAEFVNNSNKSQRDFSHPYANYQIIHNLSKQLFDSDFEYDIEKWKEITTEKLNEKAKLLYEINEAILEGEPNKKEII